MNTIKEAIDAIEKVLNVHENHLYPKDEIALKEALSRLRAMLAQGFT